jgi:hypothetical protein
MNISLKAPSIPELLLRYLNGLLHFSATLLEWQAVYDSENQRLELIVGRGCLTDQVIHHGAVVGFDSSP